MQSGIITASQLAKHFRDVYFGGNWTDVNLKDTLAGISWQQAVTKIYNCNSIALLVYHIHYYVSEVLKVLQEQPLLASDKFAFQAPPVQNADDWEQLMQKTFTEGELFAQEIEKLPETKFAEDFWGSKYGNYYRNLLGIIEHTHYHLGQIVLLQKILQQVPGTEKG
jgi:uncharacterized damage-inducible protein DinB